MTSGPTPKPLAGLRVLELGQLLAGPFAGTLLGYFGADVIKVEPPGSGDPIRGWRSIDEATGTSLWWYSLGRNKRSITVDLRREEGREVVRRLVPSLDVLIENFRPGTLERWGLGPEDLTALNPRLIVARVSGFGQTGPDAGRPGYASVCEAVGGLRHLTGHPGETPVRSNLSLGDSLAGLHAAFGILLALLARPAMQGRGQVVDVAITESIFNLLEAVVPEFDRQGLVRGPSGTTITGVAPTNAYACRDGKHVVIGANNESNFQRLMRTIGRSDLETASDLGSNAGRVARQEELDAAIETWTRTLDAHEVLARLAEANVPGSAIFTVADMAADPQFEARGLFEQVEAGGKPLRVPAILPKLTETPGSTEWAGPAVGAHTTEVLTELAGLSLREVDRLRELGVI